MIKLFYLAFVLFLMGSIVISSLVGVITFSEYEQENEDQFGFNIKTFTPIIMKDRYLNYTDYTEDDIITISDDIIWLFMAAPMLATIILLVYLFQMFNFTTCSKCKTKYPQNPDPCPKCNYDSDFCPKCNKTAKKIRIWVFYLALIGIYICSQIPLWLD